MKKLAIVLSLMFVSLNFVACAQKKDSKTRLTKGSGRESAIHQTAASYGWSILDQRSEQTELWSSNPDAAARAFIGNDEAFVGPSTQNSIAMKLSFYSNGQVNPHETMVGLRFYDNDYDPLTYFLGASMNRGASGERSGNHIRVVFADVTESGESLGNVIVEGDISGNVFYGTVTYNGGRLGEFGVSTGGSLY